MEGIDFLKNEEELPEFLRRKYHKDGTKNWRKRWLHEMGCKVRRITEGIYYDGHERADVVEYQRTILKEVSALEFLHVSNASMKRWQVC